MRFLRFHPLGGTGPHARVEVEFIPHGGARGFALLELDHVLFSRTRVLRAKASPVGVLSCVVLRKQVIDHAKWVGGGDLTVRPGTLHSPPTINDIFTGLDELN